MKIEATNNPPCIAQHIGTVQDVIAGHLSDDVTSRIIKGADLAFAFELATPQNLSSMGESVIVNNTCYATSTDPLSSDYHKVIHGPTCTPGGLFILPHTAKPTHLATGENLDFETFYKALDTPTAFVGLFNFDHFHGIAVSRPPIHGENIFDHKEKYYEWPAVERDNVQGFVMGVVAKGENLETTQLDTVLYKNPLDSASSLIHHAHVLILNKTVKTIEEVQPSIVEHCLHLFIDKTTIKSFKAQLYKIKQVEIFT